MLIARVVMVSLSFILWSTIIIALTPIMFLLEGRKVISRSGRELVEVFRYCVGAIKGDN